MSDCLYRLTWRVPFTICGLSRQRARNLRSRVRASTVTPASIIIIVDVPTILLQGTIQRRSEMRSSSHRADFRRENRRCGEIHVQSWTQHCGWVYIAKRYAKRAEGWNLSSQFSAYSLRSRFAINISTFFYAWRKSKLVIAWEGSGKVDWIDWIEPGQVPISEICEMYVSSKLSRWSNPFARMLNISRSFALAAEPDDYGAL